MIKRFFKSIFFSILPFTSLPTFAISCNNKTKVKENKDFYLREEFTNFKDITIYPNTLPNIKTFSKSINDNITLYNLTNKPDVFYSNQFPNLYNKAKNQILNYNTNQTLIGKNLTNPFDDYDVANRFVSLFNSTGVIWLTTDTEMYILTNYHSIENYYQNNQLTLPRVNNLLTIRINGNDTKLDILSGNFTFISGKKDNLYDYAFLKVKIPNQYQNLLPTLNSYYNPLEVITSTPNPYFYTYDFDNKTLNLNTKMYDVIHPSNNYTLGNFHPGSSGTGLIRPMVVWEDKIIDNVNTKVPKFVKNQNGKIVEQIGGLLYGVISQKPSYKIKERVDENTLDKHNNKIGIFLLSPFETLQFVKQK